MPHVLVVLHHEPLDDKLFPYLLEIAFLTIFTIEAGFNLEGLLLIFWYGGPLCEVRLCDSLEHVVG